MAVYLFHQLLSGSVAFAAILFGGELTFTNDAIKEEGFKQRAIVNTDAAIDAQRIYKKVPGQKLMQSGESKKHLWR